MSNTLETKINIKKKKKLNKLIQVRVDEETLSLLEKHEIDVPNTVREFLEQMITQLEGDKNGNI